MQAETQIPKAADVVIVGAGVAGLYCAYRLLLDDPDRTVAVFDLLNRVGGRLDTDFVHIKGLDSFDDDGSIIPGQVVDVKEEEGGMRFNASMPELLALIDSLGMWDRVAPFGMGDDHNFFHIRGRSFTAGESKRHNHAIWSELYNLAPNERHKSPGEIVIAIYRDLVLANGDHPPDNPTPEFWQKFRLDFTFQGVPLHHWGLWSLFRAFGLSTECITMIADTVGFQGPVFSAASAGVAYQLLQDFPLDPKFFALQEGFGSLTAALHARVRAMGGTCHLQSPVTALHSGPGGLRADLLRSGETHHVTCSNVILAVPPQALSNLLQSSPLLNGSDEARLRVQNLVGSLIPMPMCKVNLYYNHAWWRDQSETRLPQVRNGGSFTTLPLNAVYAFDPLAGEDANGPAALTIYSDHDKASFWAQLQAVGKPFNSALQAQHNAVEPQVMFAASEAIVAEATSQLRDLFRMISVPRPVLTSFRLWGGEHDFGYAYHQWARFVDDRVMMKAAENPADGAFLCNEAFSDYQGWVNGSLRSADRALRAGFGIAPLPHTNKMLPGLGHDQIAARVPQMARG